MSSPFHNRLVGTVVLVALGVIFLPDVLDGKKERHEEVFSEIPLRPEVDAAKVPDGAFKELNVVPALAQDDLAKLEMGQENKQKQTETVKSKVVVAPQTKAADDSATLEKDVPLKVQAKAAKASVKQAPKLTETAKSKPVVTPKAEIEQIAWTLQLGSFKHAGNVRALVAKLRKAGITAYTLPSTPIDGQLTKVFVGPDVSQDKLKAKQKQVYKLVKLNGRIIAYKPLNK